MNPLEHRCSVPWTEPCRLTWGKAPDRDKGFWVREARGGERMAEDGGCCINVVASLSVKDPGLGRLPKFLLALRWGSRHVCQAVVQRGLEILARG